MMVTFASSCPGNESAYWLPSSSLTNQKHQAPNCWIPRTDFCASITKSRQLRGGDGALSPVTPDGRDSKDILRSGGTDRYHLELIDALFNVENTATVQGVEIELLFTENSDIGRISK